MIYNWYILIRKHISTIFPHYNTKFLKKNIHKYFHTDPFFYNWQYFHPGDTEWPVELGILDCGYIATSLLPVVSEKTTQDGVMTRYMYVAEIFCNYMCIVVMESRL